MSCRRAFDIDLSAFIADARGAEWADFRAHYPECADCSTEVRVWTELHEGLRSGAAATSPHPSEARLVEYAERPEAIPASERQSIDRHLAGCRPCADEIATLRRFDFSALAESPAALPTTAAARRGRHPPERSRRGGSATRGDTFARAERRGGLTRAAARIGRVLLHPAFAYAIVLLLLVPVTIRERGGLPASLSASRERGTVAPEKAETAANATRPATEQRAEPEPAAEERAQPAAAPPAAPPDLAMQRLAKQGAEVAAHTRLEGGAVGRQELRADEKDVLADELKRDEGASALSADKRKLAAATGGREAISRPENVPGATFALRSDASVEVQVREVEREVHLRVPLDAEAWHGRVAVRVVGPEPGRELRQQLAQPASRHDASAPPALDVVVPAGWLVPGPYLVEVSPSRPGERLQDTDAETSSTARFAFRVR